MSKYFLIGIVAIIAMPLWFFLLSYLEGTYEGNLKWLFGSRRQALLTMLSAVMISIIAYSAYVLASSTHMPSMYILKISAIIFLAETIISLFIIYVEDFWSKVEKKQRIENYLKLVVAFVLVVISVTSVIIIGVAIISLF